MREGVYLSWLAVADIRVTHDVNPSPAAVGKTVAKLGRKTEKDTALVVRPLGNEKPPEKFELVIGWREYEASRHLGRTLIPCRIVELTDEQAAALRRLDVLMAPGGANDLIRGWELVEAATEHGWSRADLTWLLSTGRSRIADAWNAAQALPRNQVAETCLTRGVPPGAVSNLKRTEIRALRDLPDQDRLEALIAHLAASDEQDSSLSGGPPEKSPEDNDPPLDEIAGTLIGLLKDRPWTERAAYVASLAWTLLGWRT